MSPDNPRTANGTAGGTPLPDAGTDDHGQHASSTRRGELEVLVALTQAALAAARAGDSERVVALDERRRDSIATLRGEGTPDLQCAELARLARSLDAELLACVSSRRDELAAGVRRLPAHERARRSYATTDSLLAGKWYP